MKLSRARTTPRRLGAIVCVTALLVSACGDDDDAADSETAATEESSTPAETSAPAEGSSAPAETSAPTGESSSPAAPTGEPWVIPFLNDVTGTIAVSFLPAYSGFQTYMDMVNDNGGVLGRPIQVELHDAQSNPDVALTEAQKILGEDPLLFAHMGSSAAAARINPVVAPEGVAYIGGSVGDDVLFPAQPNIYQVGLTAGLQGQAIAKQIDVLLDGLDGKTVAVAAGNSPYIDNVIKAATDVIEAEGGSIGATERFDFGIPSFAAQAGNIVADGPDAVILLAPANDTVTVGSALAAAGHEGPMVGFNGAAALEVLQRLGEAGASYYAPTEVEFPSLNEELMAVAAEHGTDADIAASTFSAAGWAMASLIVEALNLCGADCTTETFGPAFESITDFVVPMGVYTGPVSFGPDDHVSASQVRFHTWDTAGGAVSSSEPITLD